MCDLTCCDTVVMWREHIMHIADAAITPAARGARRCCAAAIARGDGAVHAKCHAHAMV